MILEVQLNVLEMRLEKSESFQLYPLVATVFQNGMIEEGDKLMNILKDKNNAFFQHVAGIVSHYEICSYFLLISSDEYNTFTIPRIISPT